MISNDNKHGIKIYVYHPIQEELQVALQIYERKETVKMYMNS